MRRSALIVVLVGLLLSVLAPAATYAATITVTTRADDLNGSPSCSLREAILAASTNKRVSGCAAGSVSGMDTIKLPSGRYVLSRVGAEEDASATGDIDIHSTIKIIGAGSLKTTIDGNHTDRVFHVLARGRLSLEHVTITNGSVFGGPGGSIYNVGTLSIANSVIRQNTADSFGGGLATIGPLTVQDSTIVENVASSGGGGGIVVDLDGSANVIRSAIVDNRTLEGRGGGLAVYRGNATLTNTTVSGNRAEASDIETYAGGVSNFQGTVTVWQSTIAVNFGGTGGVSGPVTLQGTIVAENVGERGAPDCLGTMTSRGYNLIGSTMGCTLEGNTDGNQLNDDPDIGPLQQNGGPTTTHALLTGSPAIEGAASCPPYDQRGIKRPKDGDGDGKARCDIGAVERQSKSKP